MLWQVSLVSLRAAAAAQRALHAAPFSCRRKDKVRDKEASHSQLTLLMQSSPLQSPKQNGRLFSTASSFNSGLKNEGWGMFAVFLPQHILPICDLGNYVSSFPQNLRKKNSPRSQPSLTPRPPSLRPSRGAVSRTPSCSVQMGRISS